MKIELLYIAECRNHLPTLKMLRDVLQEQQLSEKIVEVEVESTGAAIALAFPGSPTVRIDGRDVEQGADHTGPYGVSCRTYLVDGRRQGVPKHEWIRQTVLSAIGRP